MNQTNKILEHLRKHGKISLHEAQDLYQCERLGARICELRKAGVPIKTEYAKYKNAEGQTIKYGVYRLKQEDNYEI